MATVGIVEWSTTLSNPASASIVYTLNGAAPGVLNRGGTAPVDLDEAEPQNSAARAEADQRLHLPRRGHRRERRRSPEPGLAGCRRRGRPAERRACPLADGHPVRPPRPWASSSPAAAVTYGDYAIIIDADGEVVWYAESPVECTRARMDYWRARTCGWWRPTRTTRAARCGSSPMDGQTTMTDIGGSGCHAHHDFAVLPGKIAAMVWSTTDIDAESNLVEMNSEAAPVRRRPSSRLARTCTSASRASGQSAAPEAYHSNSILYHPARRQLHDR